MDDDSPLPSDRLNYIEEVALVFEDLGEPRMAGRILGWLLICNPPHQSAEELAEVLQASRGSISTMTRRLMQIGMIEKVSFPGGRRDYFRIKPDMWSNLMRVRLEQISMLHHMAERGLDLLAGESLAVRQRLQDIHDLHEYIEQEFPRLIERWERGRNAGG